MTMPQDDDRELDEWVLVSSEPSEVMINEVIEHCFNDDLRPETRDLIIKIWETFLGQGPYIPNYYDELRAAVKKATAGGDDLTSAMVEAGEDALTDLIDLEGGFYQSRDEVVKTVFRAMIAAAP